MTITKATHEDIDRIMEIYEIAKTYMQANGNPTQWVKGYPFPEIVAEDIALGRLYLLRDEEMNILAQFCYFVGDDSNYEYIDGEWLDCESYGVVHRIASSGERRGVARVCLEWCFAQHPNIRIDTHSDNVSMQQVLRKMGYTECGIIFVYNGTPRVAFQKRG